MICSVVADCRGDSDPSVLQYALPASSEISVTPNGKRTKLDADQVRTIASKLEAAEYSNLSQLEVHTISDRSNRRMIYNSL
jgi:hypothetical protein